ncbi:hypothetical protein P7K49_028584 [Saguinus oedipus]|uniref:Uncharacterized protein n=1 Tax=Saguinus oedipus TaxID=9490 RepID=A0ABQ9U4R9_SAGOE|nr:hypothetical protein P7K49_028584 [Saguinus oedipus]
MRLKSRERKWLLGPDDKQHRIPATQPRTLCPPQLASQSSLATVAGCVYAAVTPVIQESQLRGQRSAMHHIVQTFSDLLMLLPTEDPEEGGLPFLCHVPLSSAAGAEAQGSPTNASSTPLFPGHHVKRPKQPLLFKKTLCGVGEELESFAAGAAIGEELKRTEGAYQGKHTHEPQHAQLLGSAPPFPTFLLVFRLSLPYGSPPGLPIPPALFFLFYPSKSVNLGLSGSEAPGSQFPGPARRRCGEGGDPGAARAPQSQRQRRLRVRSLSQPRGLGRQSSPGGLPLPAPPLGCSERPIRAKLRSDELSRLAESAAQARVTHKAVDPPARGEQSDHRPEAARRDARCALCPRAPIAPAAAAGAQRENASPQGPGAASDPRPLRAARGEQ